MRRYLFKLYPTREQADILHEHRKMCADLWNACKQRREDVYRREKRSLTFFDLTNEITELRHECPEWAAVPAVTAHRVAKWLTDAYAAFFRRCKSGEAPGYPQWRARARSTTIPLGTMAKTGWTLRQRTDNPLSWSLHYGPCSRVRDPKTWIHARGCLPAEAIDWRNGDIIWRDDCWWLSICVEMKPRRVAGREALTIELDLIDEFARVTTPGPPGVQRERSSTPEDLTRAKVLQDQKDELQSAFDLKWPRGKRRSDEEQIEFLEARREISQLAAYIARIRKNALHVWSARIVAQASDLTVKAPPVKQMTKTPRGDAKNWGANVEIVAEINKNTLSSAPATAIAMLQYKAEEAGIRCDIVEDEAPAIAVGSDLVHAGKELRSARRKMKEAA